MPNHPEFGVLARVLNRTRAITDYHDHKLDLTANNGRYITRLPDGRLVYLDEYEQKLREYEAERQRAHAESAARPD